MAKSDPQEPAIEVLIARAGEAEEVSHLEPGRLGAHYTPVTPALDALGGRLGANVTRVPPGRAACPFHFHMREDEIFYVLSGRGVLRYGDAFAEIGPGDCVSCPAGTGTGHQIFNPFEHDLVYLAAGLNAPDEVCGYPERGALYMRAVGRTVDAPGIADEKAAGHEEPAAFTLYERSRQFDG